MRRIHRTTAEDDLCPCLHLMQLTMLAIFDTHRAQPLAVIAHQHPRCQHPRQHGEIAARQRRAQIGGGRTGASAIADGRLRRGEALLLRGIEITRHRLAQLLAGRDKGLDQRIGETCAHGAQRPLATTVFTRSVFPGLGLAKVRQGMGIRPIQQAAGGPAVVVTAMAAHIGHHIDGTTAADNLAARQFDPPAVQRRLRLDLIAPVVLALAIERADSQRHMDARVVIPATRLEQQHPAATVLGQPIGQHAASRTGANDDVVVFPGVGLHGLHGCHPLTSDGRRYAPVRRTRS